MYPSVNSERRSSVVEPSDETYNIFINNVDSFNGKYILSSIYKQGFEESLVSKEADDTEKTPLEENTKPSSEKIEDSEKNDENEETLSLTLSQIISAKSQGPRTASKYKIFGSSISNNPNQKPEELYELTAETNEQFRNILTRCNCIIYDISLDESQIAKALTALSILEQDIERKKCSAAKQSTPPTIFILVSTCMTWALTTKMDPGNPDPIPFIESEYRKRKPHPNFREHYDCEKEIMKKGKKLKGKLQTIVLCSGITYGFEENLLSFLFKRAWENEHYLPIFEKGLNFVPLIHVADLAQIICKLIDMTVLKSNYILAVEQTPTTLKYIVKYISRVLGSGKIEYVVAEEAHLYPEIDQNTFDSLTADIAMEPDYIITNLGISWRSEMNLVENIEKIVEEFKHSRHLEPLKIVVLGPPCVGKTSLARLLCEYYNLHYISVQEILDPCRHESSKDKHSMHSIEEFDSFRDEQDGLLAPEVHDSEDESYQKHIAEEGTKLIPKDFHENPTRLSDEYVSMLLRREMLRNQCQNKGFVLDGCPKNFNQASILYKSKHVTSSAVINDNLNKQDTRLIPNYVIHLDAPDNFLLDRISRIPEELIQNTHYNDRDMIRRLMHHRKLDSKETSPFTYFDETEAEQIEIDVSEFPSENICTCNCNCIYYICTKLIGPPRGFGLSSADIAELEVIEQHQEKLERDREEVLKQMQNREEREELEYKMNKLLEKYHHDNVKTERILFPEVEKYRVFLSENVLPFVFEAISVLVDKKPNNPLDFFAEYLFKNNPKGRMYHPLYPKKYDSSNN